MSALVGAPGADVTTPVAACPGWTVRDVVAHLVGVIEDAVAGRFDGLPNEELTAAAVARHRSASIEALVAAWGDSAPVFEAVLTERQIWPAMLDVVSHEHDVRAALARPGARDDEAVRLGARRLATTAVLPVTIVVDEDSPGRGGEPGGPVERLTVRAAAFEVLRFRLGRRSVEQVRALSWSGDPTPILPELFIFGPAPAPFVE